MCTGEVPNMTCGDPVAPAPVTVPTMRAISSMLKRQSKIQKLSMPCFASVVTQRSSMQ